MNQFALLILILTLVGCTTPTTTQKDSTPQLTQHRNGDRNIHKNIDRLLLEAGRTTPPRSTELRLRAASLAMFENDTILATRIIDSIEAPYQTHETTKTYSFLKAELSLLKQEPRIAISLLDDRRLQNVPLDTATQIKAGKLRSRAYLMGRSYLASARELMYINNLIPDIDRTENHEKIFSTLLLLPVETLQSQAQQSITAEIRGWLSLATMTKRFQHDPLRQLNALKNWRKAWSSHSAAINVPTSLKMLSKIVAQRPDNIALILPLSGNLSQFGKAIRDGYIAAHYQLTPDSTLRIYDSTDADIQELVATAISAGAELIIGPLDRDKVTSLARIPLKVPVIALNRTLEGEINPNLYQFGLAPEDESAQVAEQVLREGRLNGLIVAPDSEWGDRNFAAFAEQFVEAGGIIVDSARFTDQRDYSDLVKDLLNVDSSEQRAANLRRISGERFEFTARRRQDIDFVFLLANATQARGINPTLAFFYAEDIPVYATSHVHDSGGSRIDTIDMNGIRFCDIPWKLTSNDSTQRIITEHWSNAAGPLAPFFALGVDAYRLYPRLQQLKEYPEERVFGSTGVLTLNEDNIVNRNLMWAQFKDGKIQTVPMILGF